MPRNADNELEHWLLQRLRQRLASAVASSGLAAGGAVALAGNQNASSAEVFAPLREQDSVGLEQLLMTAIHHAGQRDFFIQPATAPAIADFGVLAYAVASSPNLLAAVNVAITHKLFHNHSARLLLVTAGNSGDSAAERDASQIMLRHELLRSMTEDAASALTEETVSSLLGLLRWRQQFYPDRGVELRSLVLSGRRRKAFAGQGQMLSADGRQATDDDYRRHLGVGPTFEGRRTELTLQQNPLSAVADARQKNTDSVVSLLGTQTAKLYEETRRLDGMGGQLILLLIDTFGRVGKADRAAQALRTSERTMRRRLSQENTSFQRILDRYRSALAQDYLAATALSTQQIGELLGFTEATNFRRAFLRWSGRSPHDFRSALKAS